MRKFTFSILKDFGYNLHELKEGLEFVDRETKIYPLWLCPTRHMVNKFGPLLRKGLP